MRQFIKTYWLHLLLVIFGAVYSCFKVANHEWADTVFALAFAVVAAANLLTRIEYDFLKEDYADLVIDYTRELNSNLEFIQKSKSTLAGIFDTIEEIKDKNGPALVEGKPKKKPTKKNTIKKS